MVGVVLYKNTSNGSYRYVRITFFDGKYYNDIDIDKPYISYTIDTTDKRIINTKCSEDKKPPYVRLSVLYKVFDKSILYLNENQDVTQVYFKESDDTVEFKINSYSGGICTLPDYNNLHTRNGTYFLCGDSNQPKHPVLYNDIFCVAANFAANKFLDITNKLYYYACGTIYIDAGIMFNAIHSKHALKKALSYYPGYYRFIDKIHKNKFCVKSSGHMPFIIPTALHEEFQRSDVRTEHSRMIETYRLTQVIIYEELKKCCTSRIFNVDTVNALINLYFNDTVIKALNECCNVFFDFGDTLKAWCYFPKDFKLEFITAYEYLTYVNFADVREEIQKSCNARRKNFRLESGLPSPIAINCFGKCFFDFNDTKVSE